MVQTPFVLLTILGIGLLIFLHEAGHYMCARLAGVRVLVFSLGFGPRLIGFTRRGTDYRLSLVPLGGYVRVAGEDPLERDPYQDGLHSKSVPARALFFTGGVLMNLLFAFVAFPVVFKAGVEFTAPVVGEVARGGPAWVSGLEEDDRIVTVNGKSMYSFENMQVEIALAGDRDVHLGVERDGTRFDVAVRPRYDPDAGLYRIAIGQPTEDEILADVDDAKPAFLAGLRTEDRLLSINGETVDKDLLLDYELRTRYHPEPVTVEVLRGNERQVFSFTPETTLLNVPELGVVRASRRVGGIRKGVDVRGVLGLRTGDHIVAIDGRPFAGDSFEAFLDGPADLTMQVVRAGEEGPLTLTARVAPNERRALFDAIGLANDLVGVVVTPRPFSPAAEAGLRPGGEIETIDGQPVSDWEQLRSAVQEAAPDKPLQLGVRGDGGSLVVSLVPATRATDLGFRGLVAPLRELYRKETIGGAISAGMVCSIDLIKSLYVTLKKLVTGEVAAKNLGGIITISRATYLFAQRGWELFLYFLALLSINLAVINLLPIPVLDGGHLLFVLIEGIKGSPVNPKVLNYSQILGLVVIVALLVFVTYNDILRF
jgi:regulator of sigma E protease